MAFFSNIRISRSKRDKAGSDAKRVMQHVVVILITSVVAHTIAGVCTSFSVSYIVNNLSSLGKVKQEKARPHLKLSEGRPNFFVIRQSLYKGRLFPILRDDISESKQDDSKAVEILKCIPTKLELDLVGTIVSGEEGEPNFTSFATIKNPKISKTHVYQENEQIVGMDEAVVVVKIRPNQVFIRREKGGLECISNTEGLVARAKDLFSPEDSGGMGSGGMVSLTSDFVAEQIGPGMSKILSQVSLIPNLTKDGKVEGFKVFGIKGNDLLGKVGLKNGDLVLNVNGTYLSDEKNEEYGALLFKAFMDERSVSIDVNRGGQRLSFEAQIQ